MKLKNITLLALLSIIFLTSCSDFLDELPDNRIDLNSPDKIRGLLTSAYADTNFILLTELATDNVDDLGLLNPNTQRSYDEMSYWLDIAGGGNDDPVTVWGNTYAAIAHSNQALAAINETTGQDLSAERGEALITRAYSHFYLVNIFAQHFNTTTSESDLGIPYLLEPETRLDVKYERETVAEVYRLIEKDIEEALPLIDDSIYQIKTYHFNRSAAFAFAARFFLFYEKWDKAFQYANLALNNGGSLRDWNAFNSLSRSPSVYANLYIGDLENLLVQTSVSNAPYVFGPFFTGSRFNHTRLIADRQTTFAPTPWSSAGIGSASYRSRPFVYNANNLDKTLFGKLPPEFEVTDPVQQIGFRRTVQVPFTLDETILVRAEASIMLGNYNDALADISTWSRNYYASFPATADVTLDQVNTFYNGLNYSTLATGDFNQAATNNVITQKKELNPKFTIRDKDHENMLHYVLQCRRILTLHEGMRWFDIKRYGIEVPRFVYGPGGSTLSQADLLTKDDLRRALQLPKDVISAGLTPNPR